MDDLDIDQNSHVGFYRTKVCYFEGEEMKNGGGFVCSKIYVKIFALRVTNNEGEAFEQEVDNIVKFLRLDSDQTEVPLNQVKHLQDKSFPFSI